MAQAQNNGTPAWLIQRAKELKEAEALEFTRAKASVPEWLYGAIVPIERNMKLNNQPAAIDANARSLGLWSGDKGTFITIARPYLSVEGRVAWARYEHREKGAKLHILPVEFDTQTKLARVTVQSEIYGNVTATAKLGIGGQGVDSTNPFENAETSVIGRALGLLGYVLIGSGMASAEEVENAMREQGDPLPPPPPSGVVEGGKGKESNPSESGKNKSNPSPQSPSAFTIAGTVITEPKGPVDGNGTRLAMVMVDCGNGQKAKVYGMADQADVVAGWKVGQAIEIQVMKNKEGNLIFV
ncbi:hypothetical protein GTO91_17090 [Heliobacterium undosum]|uniref:Uncharacterized protein n=1 Tax=Heliomicrobium undosum TaxID=121734 RepID=A0A845L536_9FIRM|nr:hypothetical protein [Heliomicrobium undosum]MZP31413.1 hypothetical protein [Heliomicrobium undosum]